MAAQAKTFSRNAKSVKEVLAMNTPSFAFDGDWLKAFGRPERTGVWLIWGQSANGKSTFAMKLAKYLCRFGRVAYNSMEEGACLNIKNMLISCNMEEVGNRFLLIDNENMEELSLRLSKRRSPEIVIIDSFQYTQMRYKQYIEFKEANKNKLLIFISHAEGKLPAGGPAKSVMYDAALKIYVEGHRAFSKGRFRGKRGYYDSWPEFAATYWTDQNETEPNTKTL